MNQVVVIFLHFTCLWGLVKDWEMLSVYVSVASLSTEMWQIIGAASLNHWAFFCFLLAYFQRNQMCFH